MMETDAVLPPQEEELQVLFFFLFFLFCLSAPFPRYFCLLFLRFFFVNQQRKTLKCIFGAILPLSHYVCVLFFKKMISLPECRLSFACSALLPSVSFNKKRGRKVKLFLVYCVDVYIYLPSFRQSLLFFLLLSFCLFAPIFFKFFCCQFPPFLSLNFSFIFIPHSPLCLWDVLRIEQMERVRSKCMCLCVYGDVVVNRSCEVTVITSVVNFAGAL